MKEFMKKVLNHLVYFFQSRNSFSTKEWLLKQQIHSLLIIAFFFSIGIFIFSFFRLSEGNYIVGGSQLIFSLLSFYGFFHLRQDKQLYTKYSSLFLLLFFLYTAIIFFYVPQNHLNILWVISAPIFIFFFLNRRAGIYMFVLIFSFIIYLILSYYPYTVAEFVTLFASFFMTTFIMYRYEDVKEREKTLLLNYTKVLQEEVEEQTKKLKELNHTLEKRVEEEIQKRQAQEQMLLCQNRMANMGMMIDSIAHQWRQPLMHISSILMNISRVTETQPNNIEYIDTKIDDIFNITQQMSQTIDDFRNLFKPEKEKNSFKLQTLLESILTLMKKNLKEITINLKVPNELSIYSYQNELSQVLLTILTNAYEAFEEQEESLHKEIRILVEEEKESVNIYISDNAGGIKPEVLPHIFNAYYSTKKHRSGTGLGLYIAKIIIERSIKGTIRAKNIKNGTQFKISIPKK